MRKCSHPVRFSAVRRECTWEIEPLPRMPSMLPQLHGFVHISLLEIEQKSELEVYQSSCPRHSHAPVLESWDASVNLKKQT